MIRHPDQVAAALAELHRRDDVRRARQRRHYDLLGESCSCAKCRSDGPLPLSAMMDDVLGALDPGPGRRADA